MGRTRLERDRLFGLNSPLVRSPRFQPPLIEMSSAAVSTECIVVLGDKDVWIIAIHCHSGIDPAGDRRLPWSDHDQVARLSDRILFAWLPGARGIQSALQRYRLCQCREPALH